MGKLKLDENNLNCLCSRVWQKRYEQCLQFQTPEKKYARLVLGHTVPKMTSSGTRPLVSWLIRNLRMFNNQPNFSVVAKIISLSSWPCSILGHRHLKKRQFRLRRALLICIKVRVRLLAVLSAKLTWQRGNALWSEKSPKYLSFTQPVKSRTIVSSLSRGSFL